MYPVLLGKRVLKIYPSILMITLGTIISIALAAAMILKSNSDNPDKQKVAIGIVGDTQDTFFDVGVDVITDIDDSRFYFDFLTMDKKEAEKALENDEILGYLYIPEGFVDGIASLENEPATYYIANKPDNLGTALTGEVIDTVSVYISGSQQVASALREFIKTNKLVRGDSIDRISLQLITDVLLQRNKLYETEYTGIADTLSAGGYYIIGLLLFFLLLWGISCSRIFVGRDLSVARFLCTRGMGSTKQILCEYAVFTLTTVVTLLIFAVIFGIVVFNTELGIRELETAGIGSCIGFVFAILPVISAVCAMQVFMYEAVPGTVASVVLQFLTAIILGYLSGCFYPNYFFPESVRNIIDILPTGAAFVYMRKVLVSHFSLRSLLILLTYTAAFIVLSVIIRKRRLAGDGR